jgi:tetratricopeptide (TPR) repeat protein
MSDRNDVKRLAISGFHWQIARWLLTFASQRPAATDSLRLWYSATTAFMADDQNFPELTPHLSEATRLLPDDALLTFFHGWLHETLASPPVQNHREAAAAGRPMPSRTSRAHECDLRRCDRSEELALAERLMTQALERDPQLVQARVRLGHVLAERGRHVQAVDQLHRALDGSLDRVTTFEALLFLGGSQEALGRIELAADAYRRALALFPFAQSARVALSHLHSGQGAHSDAAAALRAMPPRDGSAASDRDDPWWTYHLGPGRTSDDTIGRLHALISALPPE